MRFLFEKVAQGCLYGLSTTGRVAFEKVKTCAKNDSDPSCDRGILTGRT